MLQPILLPRSKNSVFTYKCSRVQFLSSSSYFLPTQANFFVVLLTHEEPSLDLFLHLFTYAQMHLYIYTQMLVCRNV